MRVERLLEAVEASAGASATSGSSTKLTSPTDGVVTIFEIDVTVAADAARWGSTM